MKATKKLHVRVHDARPRSRGPRLSLGGTPLHRWSPVFAATRQLVMATLDLAERAVADVPEEREKVQSVRALAEARFDGHEAPKVDPPDLAFTIGLVATLAESDFSQPGLSALLLEVLPLAPTFAPQAAPTRRTRRADPAEPVSICRLCLDEYQF